jgi:hypothetical protein
MTSISVRNQKDVATIFKDFRIGLKTFFRSHKSSASIESIHNNLFSFGFVYANDLARFELNKAKPVFPAGSIIVREKRNKAEDETPQMTIAMVKREQGFSRKTGDWEFFTFNGSDLKLIRRETKSDCAKCHSQVKGTDWIFKTYLK